MSEGLLGSVKRYLREHPHPRVTPQMVESSGVLVEGPGESGEFVFDVEKQKRALGARYRDDRPLAAYATSWERYRFDPDAGTLRQIGTNLGENQDSALTIRSVPQLMKDNVESIWGIFSRAWP